MKTNSGLPTFNSLSALFGKVGVFPLLAFVIPLVVQAIPEVLMGSFVVGFDTLGYYVPNTLTWLNDGVNFWNFLATLLFSMCY